MFSLLLTTLPIIGETELTSTHAILFIICLAVVFLFEFINGFHDTANAVATVIYTHSLKPNVAVIWSGLWNFIGVWLGGIAVAVGISRLLPLTQLLNNPLEIGITLIFAILISAVIWNLSTWYFGIPCSSSHTLIGAMIGGGIAFHYFVPEANINWSKAGDMGLALLFSPLMGFFLAIALMFILKRIIKAKKIFDTPHPGEVPPLWIRAILITTCTLVSFFHGSNDGQKGVGLMMVVLIIFLPMKMSIDSHVDKNMVISKLERVESVSQKYSQTNNIVTANKFKALTANTTAIITQLKNKNLSQAETVALRTSLSTYNKELKEIIKNSEIEIAAEEKKVFKNGLAASSSLVEFSPIWVKFFIAIALGLGTMIGWKRIVVTIGQKIGKEHLSYAQGATAELIAASTIGLSTGFGLPVSTTHVLSSGVAGAMVATRGINNLRKNTIVNIGLAWILTLPVTIILSIALFFLFHLFI